ncbi:polymer-forming cytoskeletal protein [Desulfobulbus sp. F1]|jgi:cytoskeletal protein CcmA (bactofilin family)|uniref:Polymer-forming protein n=1 Tax=Candidatus Electronema aureum TaxID=2005002 RepID=A0A521G0W1_9BACT|nr:polymer-forming cytoskeletal protein [Desulfobulbus sp. F1]MCW5205901.1 polymer-forming cytoskeletal protein [Desulfobulbus sp. F5]TAA74669.1 MAG: Polymer-forming protein [Candidatus Electronema aureum]
MGLFSKEEKAKPKTEPAAAAPLPEKKIVKNDKDPIESVLAKEMTIKGEVSFKGKARFDGTIEGNITGEYLILSETANVTGNIDAATLVCHGRVQGNITAEIVTAHATSSINGILKSENLTVESGASLDGEIHASSRKQTQVSGPDRAKILLTPPIAENPKK